MREGGGSRTSSCCSRSSRVSTSRVSRCGKTRKFRSPISSTHVSSLVVPRTKKNDGCRSQFLTLFLFVPGREKKAWSPYSLSAAQLVSLADFPARVRAGLCSAMGVQVAQACKTCCERRKERMSYDIRAESRWVKDEIGQCSSQSVGHCTLCPAASVL